MKKLFNLVKEEFSQKYQEWQWTYSFNFEFFFNNQKIEKITITDHWQKKQGRETITKEFILEFFEESLNDEWREPSKHYLNRNVFIEKAFFHEKVYLLIFWFENNHPDWIWIRNCYRVD